MGSPTGVNGPQSWLVGVVVSMTILSVVFVVLRLVSRRMAQQKLWWDDWTILVSLCWNIIYVALIFAMRARNLGGPALDPEDDRAALLQLLVATQIVYAWNMCLTKISVLLMYYRTFHLWPISRAYLFLLAGFLFAWTVTATIVTIFTCAPVQKLWHPGIPGRCLNQVALWIVSAAVTVSTNLAVVLFPVPHVYGMSLSLLERVSVVCFFMMGFFVVFASAYHFSSFFAAVKGYLPVTLTPAIGWTEIEVAAGLIAACLPLLGPILTALLPSPTRPAATDGGDEAETAAVVMVLSTEGGVRGGGGLDLDLDLDLDVDGEDGSWRSPTARAANKFSAGDSRRTSRAASLWSNTVGGNGGNGGGNKRGTQEHLSNLDAWDWERAVDSLTRADELSMCQHEASAARVEDVEVPEHGISVTTDFRRWSVKEL